MCDHYNCLGELLTGNFQKAQHILTGLGIQIARRFISQDDSRSCCQCTGNCHTLLLTTGKLIWQGILLFLQPKRLYDLPNKIPVYLTTIQFNRKNNVFIHIQHRNKIICLEYKANFSAAENGQCWEYPKVCVNLQTDVR